MFFKSVLRCILRCHKSRQHFALAMLTENYISDKRCVLSKPLGRNRFSLKEASYGTLRKCYQTLASKQPFKGNLTIL